MAGEPLLLVAEHDGPTDVARIGIMRATASASAETGVDTAR